MQLAEIMPLHSSLGDRTRLCLKKNKQTKQKNKTRGRDLVSKDRYCFEDHANHMSPRMEKS